MTGKEFPGWMDECGHSPADTMGFKSTGAKEWA
jgi:hypothetical protein